MLDETLEGTLYKKPFYGTYRSFKVQDEALNRYITLYYELKTEPQWDDMAQLAKMFAQVYWRHLDYNHKNGDVQLLSACQDEVLIKGFLHRMRSNF